MIRFFLSFFLLIAAVEAKTYEKPASISEAIWQDAQPYLLPYDHPIRTKLDKLFKEARVIENTESLKAAGFTTSKPGKWSKTVVSKHKHIKGYYFKFFTDNRKEDDYPILKKRVVASHCVQAAIDRHGFQKLLKVPQKWLYPLPEKPDPISTKHKKSFILIAEDCHILSSKDNKSYWRQFENKEQLTALYIILQEEGLLDSIYPFNIPFNHQGQICFIDLEFHHDWPVPFNNLSSSLSSDMRAHWRALQAEQ